MSQDKISALQDLEIILRKSVSNQLTVVSYTTSTLLPPGENYGSVMLKLEVVIKKNKDSPEEKLHLVAKLLPPMTQEAIQMKLKTAVTFKREFFLFEKLAPAYKRIEEDFGLKDDHYIDLFPKCYGGRVVVDEKNPDMALENTVLLLKNITKDGYNVWDRKKGVDLEHAKLTVRELARFHALGMAIIKYQPELFDEAKKLLTEFPADMPEAMMQQFFAQTFKVISQDPRSAKYLERIQSATQGFDWKALLSAEPVAPWVTITHGDFWINNIMFRDGKKGAEGIKFVDFQIMRVHTPIMDLNYFLCASTSPEVLNNHYDELLDIYYDRFIEVLSKTGCDTLPYNRKDFDEELNKITKIDLFRIITGLKFITLDASEVAKIGNNIFLIMTIDGSDLYFERISAALSKYVEKGWL